MNWMNVALEQEFAEGSWRVVHIDNVSIMVLRVDGEFYAMKDECTHDGSPLSDGELEGCEMICPWHGARFDVRNGHVLAPPAYEDVPVYPVRVIDGMVQVTISP